MIRTARFLTTTRKQNVPVRVVSKVVGIIVRNPFGKALKDTASKTQIMVKYRVSVLPPSRRALRTVVPFDIHVVDDFALISTLKVQNVKLREIHDSLTLSWGNYKLFANDSTHLSAHSFALNLGGKRPSWDCLRLMIHLCTAELPLTASLSCCGIFVT